MQSQLVAVSGFIVASRAALGADDMVAKAQADQLQHLIKVFGQIRPTTEDAQATLAMLGDPNGAPGFTTEQKRELARAVMMASSNTSITSYTVARAQTQLHMYMFNYLTRGDWDTLRSPGSLDDKFSVIASRSLAIGLLHPSERTTVSLVSIVAVAGQFVWTADESLQLLNMFKRLIKLKRKSTAGVTATFLDFPLDVASFMVLHNDRYDPDTMPVPSPFPAAAFEERRLVTAARRSHKSVITSGSLFTGRGSTSTGSQSLQDVLMATIMNQLLPSLNGFKPGVKNKEVPITFTCGGGVSSGHQQQIGDTHRTAVAPLAIEDGSQSSAAEQTPKRPTTAAASVSPQSLVPASSPCGGTPKTEGIDEMIRNMQEQMAENSGSKSGKTAIPKARLPKKKSKRSATKAKAKAKAKATAKSEAKVPTKPTATAAGKRKTEAKPTATAAGNRKTEAKAKLVFGCAKCRGNPKGCTQCRSPKFASTRGPR